MTITDIMGLLHDVLAEYGDLEIGCQETFEGLMALNFDKEVVVLEYELDGNRQYYCILRNRDRMKPKLKLIRGKRK